MDAMNAIWKCFEVEYKMINLPFKKDYLLCVECLTYNQAEYVQEFLEGIINQNTDFNYCVLVIDDASYDGTSEILEKYARDYPDMLGVLISKKNTFRNQNRNTIYQNARKLFMQKATYIATCEGDDFWTDSDKLQIQVDYLQNHPECMMYLHNTWWLNCKSLEKKIANSFECMGERNLEMKELLAIKNGHPATASRVFRMTLYANAPDFLTNCSVGDYNLMTYARVLGTVHYSDRVMCTYRFMSGNSTTDIMNENTGKAYAIYHDIGIAVYLINLDNFSHRIYHDIIKRNVIRFIAMATEKANGLTINDYYDLMYPFKVTITPETEKILSEMIRRFNDDRYLNKDLRKYIYQHDNIAVFGTGRYSRLLIRQLENNGIDPVFFVKSKVEPDEKEYHGKEIWTVEKYSENLKDVGLIISTLPKCYDDIEDILCEFGIDDYIYAYGV